MKEKGMARMVIWGFSGDENRLLSAKVIHAYAKKSALSNRKEVIPDEQETAEGTLNEETETKEGCLTQEVILHVFRKHCFVKAKWK